MSEGKGMDFPKKSVFLLAGIFLLGSMAGAFVYATGDKVAGDMFMKMVSHTEYRFGEEGQIVARLVDFQGNAVAVENCTATILYPNKTFFVNSGLMQNSTNIEGDHYYNFTTPQGPEGVYEYQATCFYQQGAQTKNTSVTNSFHLSGAFNDVLNNLSQVRTDISDLSTQLNTNTSQILTELSAIESDLTGINNTLNTEFSDIQTNFSDVFAEFNTIQQNFSQQNEYLQDINSTVANLSDVNLTPVLDKIDELNSTMTTRFDSVDSDLSAIITNQQAINSTVNDIDSLLNEVNVTTVNTYDYVTGTLATNVNSILTTVGVINATVNRIETTTDNINSTVNEIKTNQENEVKMTVFSG